MQIVTTHTGTDFDALASVVACTFLYPGSVGVLPGMMNPEVKQFLALHGDILQVRPRKGLELDQVTSLIVVDANNWRRLDKMETLSERDDLEVICWDHHMEGVTIESSETHREEVGAAVTLLLEEMQRRDAAFTPMHATLFLLGIYSDTGCLRYSSVTGRDAAMAGYLIDNGADLNVVSAYLDDPVDDAHTEVFRRMLDEAEVMELDPVRIGMCAMEIKSGLTSLGPLVEKFRDFRGLDAAIGVFQADSQKCMIIGRGRPRFVDVGQVMRALGGGGHPGAGSAIIKKTTPAEAAGKVRTLLAQGCYRKTMVKEVMSAPSRFVVDVAASMDQASRQLSDNNVSGLFVCSGRKLLGGLSAQECDKAEKSGRSEVPVKGYCRPNIPKLSPDTCCRDAIQSLTDAREGILAVVEGDELIGVVTKGDLMLQVYDF